MHSMAAAPQESSEGPRFSEREAMTENMLQRLQVGPAGVCVLIRKQIAPVHTHAQLLMVGDGLPNAPAFTASS